MDVDKRIKQALERESQQIDQMMMKEKGIFGMLLAAFQGNMRFWIIVVNIVVLIATAGFIYCGYHFWIAENVDDRLFWGVLFVALLQVQISLKMWNFMEMNRVSTVREIKRVEIQLARMNQPQ